MTEQQRSIFQLLRLLVPISTFFIVLFIGMSILSVPLVLVVVIACLFAILEWVTMTWIMNRQGG